jgi:hypothetical protein
MPRARPTLTDAQRQQFAALILLDRVVTQPGAFHAALLESRDDAMLEATFRFLVNEDLVLIGDDDRYHASGRGQRAYRDLLHRQQSYLAHFEIFARVDLGAGEFADPDSPYDDPRFNDLRVAVAEYKGIDPFRIVFQAMLADEAFFRERDWKFELALGSALFGELEAVVASQLSLDHLAYESEEGERVTGEAVLEDVIVQAAHRNREHLERERARLGLQPALPHLSYTEPRSGEEGGSAGNGGSGAAEEPSAGPIYDPFHSLAFYEASAQYVEPIWLQELW